MWGEFEERRSQQHHVPLWHEGWRPIGVSCQIPRVLSNHKLSLSSGDRQSLLSLLDHPVDSHNSNLLLHSIELRQYIEEMEQMISSSSPNASSSLHNRESLMAPPPPTKHWSTSGRRMWEKPNACDPNRVRKLPSEIYLDSKSCHLLQRKSVATVSLVVGYEVASSHSLDVLSDVLGDFLKRFCCVLKENSEDVHRRPPEDQGSLDLVIESTLNQFGIGGKRDLTTYWRDQAKKHTQLIEEASQQVANWERIVGGVDVSKDRDELLKSMKLQLVTTGGQNPDTRLPTPWVANTPVLMGEEETSITSDINLDNVVPLKTPDVAGTAEFPHLSTSNEDEMVLELESAATSRKRSRSSSIVHEN